MHSRQNDPRDRLGRFLGWLFGYVVLTTSLVACHPTASPPQDALRFRPPERPQPSVTLLSEQSWQRLATGGRTWQVDWSTVRLNLNEEGVPFESSGEAQRYSVPDGMDGQGDGPNGRFNFFTAQRAYPLNTLPDAGVLAIQAQTQALLAAQASAAQPVADLPPWQNIGPAPMRNSKIAKQSIDVSGRVLSLAIDPRNSNVIYLGAALGGVWKSSNGGQSWTPTSDNQASLAIGALALDPKNPDIVYAGTGESTTGGGNYYGAGILKSSNGGQSWQLVGAEVFGGLGISKIIVDPRDSSVVYAAAARSGVDGPSFPRRAVFKSGNGGQSWEALIGCSEQDCNGMTDLVVTANGTLFAGASGYGVVRSIDGGANWQLLTNGLPDRQQYLVQRVMLDSSQSNPNVIYASIHLGVPQRYDGAVLFKTVNGGESWTEVSIGTENYNFCGEQCWYSHEIAVHPTNPDVILLGGMASYVDGADTLDKVHRVIVRVSNNGKTLTDLTPNTSPSTSMHPDMHVITFDPNNPQVIWAGNDGGIFVSQDGGATWQGRNNGLATLQFTGFAVDPQNDLVIQGGMQDNNKAFTLDGGATLAWTATDVGDGGFAAIDPFNSTIWYGTRFGISFQRNDKAAGELGYWPYLVNGIDPRDRALFYIPIALDPSTQGTAYLGTNQVYQTRDRGQNWRSISPNLSKGNGSISTMAVAPSVPATIWAGTSDGNIAVTRDSGGKWTDVTQAPLPNRYVSRLAVSPNDANVAYAVFNGFDTHTPDTPGHLFKTKDGGATWQNISGNLPDVPALSIVLDRNKAGTIYLGTDAGVFRSTNDGGGWEVFNNGLPNVAVTDLSLNRAGNILFAATYGRSVYRVILEGGAIPGARFVYLPAVQRAQPVVGPTETPTPTLPSTATSTPVPTNTPRPTNTPETPVGTVLPTLPPTLTPTHTPTSHPTNTPVSGPTPTITATPNVNRFRDEFTDATSGWRQGNDNVCRFAYVDSNGDGQSDRYEIETKQEQRFCIAVSPATAVVHGSYEVLVVQDRANSSGSVFGLIFGLNSTTLGDATSRFYVLWLDSLYGAYAVERYDQGQWTSLTGTIENIFVSSEAIDSLAAGHVSQNLLRIHRQVDQIDLFVNATYLATIHDNTFANFGFTGLLNWYGNPDEAKALTSFERFEVNAVQPVYQDDYGDEASGWSVGDIEICQAQYANGEYHTASQADYICYFRAPADPQLNGRFEATMRSEESFYPMAYGVMAGEDGNFGNFYAFLVIPDTRSYALAKYTEDQGWLGITWNEESDDAWLFSDLINSGINSNQLAVERDDDLLRIFINGQSLGAYIDPDPLATGYYGLLNWASAFEPALANFDNYKVTAWDATVGTVQAADQPLGTNRQASQAVPHQMSRLSGVVKVE